MLQLSARRACACGNAIFSGVASTADFKRQDFKEINMILNLTSLSALACNQPEHNSPSLCRAVKKSASVA
jgi:hypothetical protein